MNRKPLAPGSMRSRAGGLVLLLMAALLSGAGAESVTQPAAQASPSPTPLAGVRILRDLAYVPNGGPRQKLDLYLPEKPGPARPLVAWIHGGAWRAGTKNWCPAQGLVPQGYVAASIEYRFSQDATFPAQIEDCKAAIRWLRANAAEYGIDPNHIGVWGASAGGHLVALLGVTGTSSGFDTGANLDQSSAVQCVVDFFGPTDFLHYGVAPNPKLDTPDSAVDKLLGGSVAGHPDLARRASPVYFITGAEAPFLILQGDHDPLVPLQQSQELDAVLEKAGDESTLKVIAGGAHGGKGFGAAENLKLLLDFFNRHLKPQG